MDKNRLIQIANHFDKIGAYTVSDEFENKFIREAQAVKPGFKNKRKSRNKVVTELAPTTGSGPAESAWNVISGYFRGLSDPNSRRYADNLGSLQSITTWESIIGNLYTKPSYKLNPKKVNVLVSIANSLRRAETDLRSSLPVSISTRRPTPDRTIESKILEFAGDDEVILREFLAWVDYEDQIYRNTVTKDPYINSLRSAELEFTKLAFPDAIEDTPVTPPAPTPSGGGTTTPSGGGTTTPSGGGSSSKPSGGGTTTPSGGGTTTPSGGGSSSKPSGGGTRPSARPNSGPKPPVTPSGKPSSKTTNLSVNEELSKIVFRKVKAYNPKLQDDNIFLDMRIDNKYKTYLDVSKDKGLDGSIRAAIKASSFSDEFKQKLIKRLDAKIAKAIELNKAVDPVKPEPVKPEPVKPEPVKPEPTPGPVDPNKPDPVNPAKPDADGFRCTREGLFTEIGRMDTLHNNDPDKYIRSYFGDIKRVIDCHESLRNSLNLKDNTQLDSLINILEAKYFSIITKTQFPY